MKWFACYNSQFLIGPSPSDLFPNLAFIYPCSYHRVPSEVDPTQSVHLPQFIYISCIKILLLFGQPRHAHPFSWPRDRDSQTVRDSDEKK